MSYTEYGECIISNSTLCYEGVASGLATRIARCVGEGDNVVDMGLCETPVDLTKSCTADCSNSILFFEQKKKTKLKI